MGFTIAGRVSKSIISYKRAWRYNPEDPADFRGTISCRPCDDTPGQTLSDWERLDYDNDGSVDEARER